jgi:signal transduction histidine kinase
MTIRRTLLLSYLLISVASALLITLMIFLHFREVLRIEIENKLTSQAAAIMQQIDTTLFERMENMSLWSQLEVMQDVKSKDVDKRLSQFLNKLHTGYDGVYQTLFIVNQQNQIVSASDAALIGRSYQSITPWLNVALNNDNLAFQPLDVNPDKLYFSIAIADAFQTGQLGRLYAGFDWQEIIRLLDTPLPFSSGSSSYALLVDNNKHIIATSSELKKNNLQFYPLSGNWLFSQNKTGTLDIQADFLDNAEVLVGYAYSQGYRNFKGLGWRVLILQPRDSAFAPILNLWMVILVFLVLTVIPGVAVSIWMSINISQPIVKLAEFSRDFMQGKSVSSPQLNSSTEVNELSLQFIQMINNLEQSRQDMVRVAKLAVVGEMAASMAHEVRTPLGILRSSAQMLQREPALSEIGLEMTEFILSETKRLNELVTTLLECAKPKLPHFTQQDLHCIIEHSLDLLQSQADAKQIELVLQFDNQEAFLLGDRDQLIQVFLNLIMNAIQHVNKGGRIEISSQINKQQFEVQVADNGHGISDENKSKVFDPFFTRRQEGIGLGLTVVQQIVLAHHGKIFVTDSVYGGACFHVVLPINQQEQNSLTT